MLDIAKAIAGAERHLHAIQREADRKMARELHMFGDVTERQGFLLKEFIAKLRSLQESGNGSEGACLTEEIVFYSDEFNWTKASLHSSPVFRTPSAA